MTEQAQLKNCPFCGESILATARKCRFCSEFLDGYTRESIWQTENHNNNFQENNVDGDQINGDKINGDKINGDKVGHDLISADVQNSTDVAVGDNLQTAKTGDIFGTFNQIKDLRIGENLRDRQYQTVLHWDGKTRLREFDLSNRVLSDLDLRNADLSGSNLTNADLRKTDLRGVNLWQTKLQGAQLQLSLYNDQTKWPEGFDYPHSGAVGPRAVLSGSDLHGIVLSDLDLREVDLSSANFSNAMLSSVDFSQANLARTDFSNAKLYSVNFSRASLVETNFRSTQLRGVRFESAILLPSTKLIGANYDYETSWPEQFDPVRAVMPDLGRGARILELTASILGLTASILLIPLKLFALAVKKFPIFVFVSVVGSC